MACSVYDTSSLLQVERNNIRFTLSVKQIVTQPVLYNWYTKSHSVDYPGYVLSCIYLSSWCSRSSDQSLMVNPLSHLLFQPVLHDWINKGCGMCYPVCGMIDIKEPLLLIGKSSISGSSGFLLLLSE